MKKIKISFRNVFSNIENWAEEHRFWADTVRTIILGVLGAYLVATFIERVKNASAYGAEINKARLNAKIEAIKDFAAKSYKFTLSANRFKEDTITFNELRDYYDDFRIAKHQMYLLTDNIEMAKDDDIISTLMLKLLTEKDDLKSLRVNKNKINDPQDGFEQIRQLIKQKSDSVELKALRSL